MLGLREKGLAQRSRIITHMAWQYVFHFDQVCVFLRSFIKPANSSSPVSQPSFSFFFYFTPPPFFRTHLSSSFSAVSRSFFQPLTSAIHSGIGLLPLPLWDVLIILIQTPERLICQSCLALMSARVYRHLRSRG